MISDKSYVNSILHYTISLVEGGKKPKMNQLTFSSSIVCSYQHYYYHQEGLLLLILLLFQNYYRCAAHIRRALEYAALVWNRIPPRALTNT